MRNKITFLFLLMGVAFLNAQTKKSTEKKKDTVKTEIVNVISSYTPTIADAFKIKKNPKIELLNSSKKRPMKYSVFSAPVASTFIPKSGVVKGINLGKKERLYNNYAAVGFGNYTTPFVELFLHNENRYQDEYGLFTKYTSSENSVENTFLNSNYSDFKSRLFYGRKERILDWKITFNSERAIYNWYGLPDFITNNNLQNAINEEQRYNLFELVGDLNFKNSYIDIAKAEVSYYSDAYQTKELLLQTKVNFKFPLKAISPKWNDLKVESKIAFLTGEFQQDYQGVSELGYSIFTASIQPNYEFTYQDFSVKIGIKSYLSLDIENSITNLLLYPDLKISTPIVQNHISLYAGATGDLYTNTYKSFSDENPFVSPTLFITQTSESYNYFLGFNGKINQNISFNIKGNYTFEEDKALFIRNNSKFNGTTPTANDTPLKGYEYGNSFGVYYDDITTTSLFGEIEYDFSEIITLGTNFQLDNFETKNSTEAWNLPTSKASLFGKYNKEKWMAETTVFYVGERKDAIYSGSYPSSISGSQSLDAYIDINISGSYHFNDKFSTFLRLKNILNNDYQRFSNFHVQGFQILGGFTYKFNF
jgi:hypothetical protein